MENEDIVNEDVPVELLSCQICGRTFLPNALQRHEKICEKANTKQRKVFDSFKQRAKSTGVHRVKPEEKEKKNKDKPKWKEKHEEFIRAIRAEKGVDQPNFENCNRSSQKYVPSDYIQCPCCNRYFNHKAADRHISWCQEQKSRIPKSPASSVATERLKARIKYRAPLPVKKKNDDFDAKRPVKSAGPCKSVSFHQSPLSTPGALCRISSQKQGNSNKYGEAIEILAKMNDGKRPSFSKEQKVCSPYIVNNSTVSPLKSARQVVKFKEKFPVHPSQSFRMIDSDNDYGSYRRDDQLSDLLKTSQLKTATPRTVPGVRTSSQISVQGSSWTSRRNTSSASDDLLNVLQRKLADLGNANSLSEDDFTAEWFRKLYTSNSNPSLPEVSSSETPAVTGREQWSSDGDTRLSTSSSSDSSLPPVGRESSSEGQLPRFCYQCGTKYPIASAKYCCECGAKRLGVVRNNNLTTNS